LGKREKWVEDRKSGREWKRKRKRKRSVVYLRGLY
jgi:hypothetical protein